MKTKSTALTGEELDVLILHTVNPRSKYLSPNKIARRLGISVSKVKKLLHQACVNLGAHNRAGAVALAIKQKEIIAAEICPLKEWVKALAPLGAEYVEKMAQLLTKERLAELFLPGYYPQLICRSPTTLPSAVSSLKG